LLALLFNTCTQAAAADKASSNFLVHDDCYCVTRCYLFQCTHVQPLITVDKANPNFLNMTGMMRLDNSCLNIA